MFYKNWPYWLKGGVVGLIIGICVFVSVFPAISSDQSIDFFRTTLIFPGIILYFLIYSDCAGAWLLEGLGGGKGLEPMWCSDFYIGVFIVLIVNLVFYFIAGAIIGLIYGKIKNKNNIIKK